MPSDPSPVRCRSCGNRLDTEILDLGPQPVADVLVSKADAPAEPVYPLGLAICSSCLLVQLASNDTPPTARHGHGAAYSSTVLVT